MMYRKFYYAELDLKKAKNWNGILFQKNNILASQMINDDN